MGTGSFYDYATVKYNGANGALQWVQRYNGSGNDFDKSFALVVKANFVYVTGWSRGSTTGLDYVTIRYTIQMETAMIRRMIL